jgi:hypothetical protein
MKYESDCCGVRIINGQFVPYCSKCLRVCDVVRVNDDPDDRERNERKAQRKALVKMLNRRRRK